MALNQTTASTMGRRFGKRGQAAVAVRVKRKRRDASAGLGADSIRQRGLFRCWMLSVIIAGISPLLLALMVTGTSYRDIPAGAASTDGSGRPFGAGTRWLGHVSKRDAPLITGRRGGLDA